MLDRDALARLLPRHARYEDEAQYVRRYQGPGGEVVGLKRTTDDYPLVLHPKWSDALATSPVPGVDTGGQYHNSNLRGFPKRLHTGRTPIGYGCAVAVRDADALAALFARIEGRKGERDPVADIEAERPRLAVLEPTEREALVSARLGQGRFRASLLAAWGGACAVSGIDVSKLLRASHIKPWRESTDAERLSPDNGLLLVATLDAAFDAGLIGFGDCGAMLVSPRLGPTPHAVLGVEPGARLRRAPTAVQRDLLRHHREVHGLDI